MPAPYGAALLALAVLDTTERRPTEIDGVWYDAHHTSLGRGGVMAASARPGSRRGEPPSAPSLAGDRGIGGRIRLLGNGVCVQIMQPGVPGQK